MFVLRRKGEARQPREAGTRRESQLSQRSDRPPLWTLLGPGLLLAATGVGGGDLATATFAGSHLGTTVLWAVLVGSLLKFVVTEGLARWQLATGDTLLEGLVHRLGPAIIWVFLPYLLLWTFFVGSAQMSACGVALHAALPVFDDAYVGKIVFGIASSVVGVVLVLKGGYRLFEQVMRVCIGVMFFTVFATAVLLWPGFSEVLRGLFLPDLAHLDGQGLTWTVALIGGVGGTVSVLFYGYWLREEGRTRPEDLHVSRLDLGMGYVMTGLFGVCMVIVGSHVEVEGSGASLLVTVADLLIEPVGPIGKWLFLAGAVGAVFSSLLGVWQGVPYLFADCWQLTRRGSTPGGEPTQVDERSWPYRGYLVALAIVPMIGLFWSFRDVQKIYTITGAMFFPFLTVGLLVFNSKSWLGEHGNGPATVAALLAVLAFFSFIAVRTFG